MNAKHDSTIKSILVSIGILAVSTLIGFGFAQLQFDRINTILVYITGIVVIAMETRGRFYSMTASVLAVISFNFFFAKPYFSLAAEPSYLATFAVMLLASFLISSLTVNIKEASEQAARSEEQAKQEELRSNLLRSISHDLRTPLTGIYGNAELLSKHGNELSPETRNEIYNSVKDDSKWLINLVENLLSITRINNEVAVSAQEAVIQEIADEALEHIDADKVNYTITRHYDDEPVLAKMDSKLMMQVIINIVNNAIKYTPKGTRIDIEVRRNDDLAEIIISDNGNGISDDAKLKIFDKFYSEGKLKGDSRRGLGLGLYLCKTILESHGGNISVEDNNPNGTIFICTLPAVKIGE